MKRTLITLAALLLAPPAAPRAQDVGPALLDLALEPPVVNTRPGPEYDDAVRPGNMIIGIDRTPKGRLWAAWVGNGDNPNGFFLLASSDDGGKSWSKPRVVIDPTDPPGAPQRRALVGNVWTDPLGRLWLFFDQSLGYFDGRCGDWYTRCDNPDDEEPAWSRPVRLADGCTLNKPTVLSNGDWLLPVSLWTRDRIRPDLLKDAHRGLDAIRMANVFASTDQGQTWTRRGGVAFPETEFDEHMIVERRDGSLWMLARTRDGISESVSADKGATWSVPQPSPIQNPSARFFIRRLASGRLLLVKNGPIDARLPRRSSLTAFLSDDDGKTWGEGLLLDDRALVSYPDGFQAPDGTIHILYDWNRHTDAEILLAKFTEADIAAQTRITRTLVNKAYAPQLPQPIIPDPRWTAQAAEDAQQDYSSIPYDGVSPDRMVCDTTLRRLPDGSWILFILAGGDVEPSPLNYVGVTRSADRGKSWTPLERFEVGFPREGKTRGQGPTEVMILGDRATLFFSTHSRHWADDWRSWYLTSDDGFTTRSEPFEAPGRLKDRTFLRNHIVTRDGRILVPFQHYIGPDDEQDKAPLDRDFTNPRNGVIISADGGKTWTEHGDIRLTPNDRYFGWAENNVVELKGGSIAMIIRADGLGGVLYRAVSRDGGRTWPEFAGVTPIPNPGSKATLYGLGGDAVALLHNPNSKHRSPMALWISFDGMKTWPYQRILRKESCDGPRGRLNYPDGFVTEDRQWLHFAFDDNRHRAVHYSAKLPPLPQEPAVFTTRQDHQNMLDQLGITRLRPGRDSNPNSTNPANYDQAKANPYPKLPELLVTKDGKEVTTPGQWWDERRPEIVELLEREVYGRIPEDVPQVRWEVRETREVEAGGKPAIRRHIVGEVDNSSCPQIEVHISLSLTLPKETDGPVPVLMSFGWTPFEPSPFGPRGPGGGPRAPSKEDTLIAAGWGCATLNPATVQDDAGGWQPRRFGPGAVPDAKPTGAGLTRGIIGLTNHGQPRRPDQWGALRAWAWGASRGLDYLETVPGVDAKRVGIAGVSRYGKAALVTMAFDQRFAIGLIASSGAGGTKLFRRDFGENLENLATTGAYHWMAGNFLRHAAEESSFGRRTAADLPVDAHSTLSLCAPRLTFISHGIPERGDAHWLDHQGSFMAAIAAQPVFRLLGARDLGRSDDYRNEQMPGVNVDLLGGALAWRQHDGGHTDGPNVAHFIRWAEARWREDR